MDRLWQGWLMAIKAKRWTATLPAVFLAGAMGVGGCATTSPDMDAAQAAYNQRDYRMTIQRTQQIVAQNPPAEQMAEALYLQGRAYEEITAATPPEAAANLAAARRAYVQALQQNPSGALEGRIRTAVANVAYHQEDYATALQQWQAAFNQIDLDDQRPWILYRIGLSHQRLGQFDRADQAFAQVQQRYPGTLPAQRAQQHQGYRQFYVQLGTFSSPTLAERLAASVRKKGYQPLIMPDTAGRQTVRVGPVQTWAEARKLQGQLGDEFTDTMIVP